MGRARLLVILGLALLGLGALALALMRSWALTSLVEVRALPVGHQEIAWIAPATSGESWERLVASLELLRKDATPGLRVDFDKAFLPLTADVPEVALYFDEDPNVKLWIRWYKLTGENPSRRWFEKLSQRHPPPLAIIGGDTSDRALFQSRALREVRAKWPGPAPLYLIATATADRYYPLDFQAGEVPHATWPKLMEVYDRRTFRFCFTNARIVEAVLDFIRQNPQVCSQRLMDPRFSAGIVAQGDVLGSLGFFGAAGPNQPYHPTTIIWKDDGYSKDLGEIFLQTFSEEAAVRRGFFSAFYNNYIAYSVGDFLEPNPREAQAVGLLLEDNPNFGDQPQILALPTGAQPARRFLRALCRRAPLETRNVVVVTGDAISFNTIYRDRNIAWNIQDMPVPLVFFCHRNPMDAKAGFEQKAADGSINHTGTQDVLLYRDMIETLVLAAFAGERRRRSLADNPDQLLERLGHTRWHKGRIFNDLVENEQPGAVPFFDGEGNRRADTGEHVLWLRPLYEGRRNLAEAVLTVWRAGGEAPDRTWRTFAPPLNIRYDRPNQEETDSHGP